MGGKGPVTGWPVTGTLPLPALYHYCPVTKGIYGAAWPYLLHLPHFSHFHHHPPPSATSFVSIFPVSISQNKRCIFILLLRWLVWHNLFQFDRLNVHISNIFLSIFSSFLRTASTTGFHLRPRPSTVFHSSSKFFVVFEILFCIIVQIENVCCDVKMYLNLMYFLHYFIVFL